jgi:hypothetical protein
MSDYTIRKLAFAEYDFAGVDAKLSDLAALLRECAREAPSCGPAALNVTRLRYGLRGVLLSIDEELTAAVSAAETRLEPAPF